MFKAAFAERRCLVALLYESDDPDGKTPFAVARIDGEPVAFGGIWERWQSPEGEILQTFATITTDANRQLASIQDRMPVIIERQDWALWLGEPMAIPVPCYGPHPRTSCGSGRSGKPSATSGTTDPNCSSHQLLRSRRSYNVSVTVSRRSSLQSCAHHLKGARQWRTTTYPWRI